MNILNKLGIENTTKINDIHINISYKDVNGKDHQILCDIQNEYVSVMKDDLDISKIVDRSKIVTDTDFINTILESEALSDFHTYVHGYYINISE